MADDIQKNIILSVQTDTTQAADGVNQLKNDFNNLNETKIDKPFKSLKAEIREATEFASQMERQFGKNSQEFTNAAKRVANLKDEFSDLNKSVEAFNPDNKLQALVSIAGGAVTSIQGVMGAMQFLGIETDNYEKQIARLQGLMAFSDALNGIDGITVGFKNFGSVIQSNTAYQKASNTATTVASTVQKLFTGSVNTTSTSFKVLKGAIISTGIGALVIAVVALIQNFDFVKQKILNLFPGLGKLASFIGGLVQKFTDFIGVTSAVERSLDSFIKTNNRANEGIDSQIKILEAQGGKEAEIYNLKKKRNDNELNNLRESIKVKKSLSEEEAKRFRELKTEQQVLDVSETKRIAEKNKKDTEQSKKDSELYNKKIEQIKEFGDKYKTAVQTINDIANQSEKDLALISLNEREKDFASLNDDIQKKRNVIQKAYEDEKSELQKALKNKLINQTEFNAKDSQLSESQNKASENLLKEKAARELELEKKYSDKISEVLFEARSTEFEKKKAEIVNKYDELIKIAGTQEEKLNLKNQKDLEVNLLANITNSQDNVTRTETTLLKTESENLANPEDSFDVAIEKIQAIEQAKLTAEQAAFELKRIQVGDNKLELERIEAEHSTKINQIQKEAADKEIEIDKKKKEAKEQLIAGISQGLGNLSALVGKQTAAGKAFAIAQTVIDTYQSAMKAYNSLAGIPVVGPVLGGIAAAAAVKMGFDNIRKIKETKVPGQADVSAPTPSLPTVTAPTVNAFAISQQSIQDVRVTNQQQQQPLKAYIVDKDLESQAQKSKFLNQVSTF